MKLAIFLLALLVPHALSSITCGDFITQMEARKANKNYENLTPEQQAFLNYSATLVNVPVDFGNQEACANDPLMKYFMAARRYFAGPKSVGFSSEEHGICLPASCSEIQGSDNQEMIIRAFDLRDFPTTMTDPAHNVTFFLIDPTLSTTSPKPMMFYVTVLAVGLFILAGIVSTIILAIRPADKNAPKEGIVPVLVCLDIKKNLKDFYQTAGEQKQNENIAVFQFLKLITSWWVVYYHTIGQTFKRVENFSFDAVIGGYYSKFISQIESTGDLTVEYFFVMTGFLAAYTLIPKLAKVKVGMPLLSTYYDLIKHRILRVRVMYVIALLCYWKVIPYLFSGPLWHVTEWNASYCDKSWWRNMLMIDNFANFRDIESNTGGYCLPVGWYLSAEFQMWVVALVALTVYGKNRKWGLYTIYFFIVQSFITGIIISFVYGLDFWRIWGDKFMTLHASLKFVPHPRWFPLFIGAFWGVLYYEYNKQSKKNIFHIFETNDKLANKSMIGGLILNLSIAVIQFVISPNPDMMPVQLRYCWTSIRILMITVSITMIFMPLISNRQSKIKSFMNHRIFQVLGKTSYIIYLSHILFVEMIQWSSTTQFEFSYLRCLYEVIKVLVAVQLFSIVFHNLVEKPFLNLELHFSRAAPAKKPVAASGKATDEVQLVVMSQSKEDKHVIQIADQQQGKDRPAFKYAPLDSEQENKSDFIDDTPTGKSDQKI